MFRAAIWLSVAAATAAFGQQGPDVRAVLDEAREVSYQQHWRDAQRMLDEIEPFIDQARLREYADFHLLEARHLVLADRSEEGLARAEALLELELDPDQRLRALQFGANIGVLLREYERAFQFLGQALAVAPEVEDPAPRSATLNMASYMFGRVGEHERGIEYGRRAVALARETGNPSDACVAQQRLAPVYKWAERHEDAERVYRQGIEDCRRIGNELFVGVLQHGLADLLRRRDRHDEALDLANQAIAALEQAVYPLGEYEARLVRAETRFELGELHGDQVASLDRLAAYFAEHKLWDQMARLEKLRADLAGSEGRHDAAFEHLQAHLAAREAFLGRERTMRLAYLQVEFDSRFQAQEIELLRESARAARLEARAADHQRRFWIAVIALSGLALIGLLVLMARLFRSRQWFRELSRQDSLSGLANHGWFFERAQAMLDRPAEEVGPSRWILVAADVDHFKRINDIHGHRTGDEVLGAIARRLRQAFPDHALVGRVGGEEFAVLIRAGHVDDVIECIKRFRRPGGTPSRAGDPDVTLSFGLSCQRPGDNIERLRERADQALYRAKQAGRDRWMVDSDCTENHS